MRSTASRSVTRATGMPKSRETRDARRMSSTSPAIPFAWPAHENFLTCSSPRATRAARASALSHSSFSSAAAMPSTLSGSNAIATSAAISPREPLFEQAQGIPFAIASTRERPKPSKRLGKT